MGMFDNIKCDYPLPDSPPADLDFQTKSLECGLDNYSIRADGTLWVQKYDIEDRSDPNAEGWRSLAGSMTRVNQRWEQVKGFRGQVVFYDFRNGVEWEFSALFNDGKVIDIRRVNA